MERLGPVNKPAPYVVADRKEWIVAEERDECAGFAIYIRTDISNAEQQWLIDQNRDILRYQEEEWNQLPGEERDMAESPRRRQWALIAPYILDWNAWGYLADGATAEIAPPSVNGPTVLDAIKEPERRFCERVVLVGYTELGKALVLPSRSSPSGEPSAIPTPQDIPTPSSSRRRKTSSTPSASISAD